MKLDETLTISGKAEPKSSIIMTLSNADGDKEKIRVVSVDVNGEFLKRLLAEIVHWAQNLYL